MKYVELLMGEISILSMYGELKPIFYGFDQEHGGF